MRLNQVTKMSESLPSQTEILGWMSISLIEKLNQSVQDKDWAKVTAILNIARAVTECMEELR
jgi:hypothetical protein